MGIGRNVMISRFLKGLPTIGQIGRQGLWLSLLVLALLLTGCVDSFVGIRFDSPQRGEITQHLRLADSLNSQTTRQWLDLIQRQSRALGGHVDRTRQALTITIPFTSGADLERKFNQLLSDALIKTDLNHPLASPLPAIDAHFSFHQSNFLLVERNRLRYDVDLRPLGVQTAGGNVVASPAKLLDLEFSLITPWGARSVKGALLPEPVAGDRGLNWSLVAGQQNRIEAVFWLPNPLGIGTLVIVLLVLVGLYVKSQVQPTRSETVIPS